MSRENLIWGDFYVQWFLWSLVVSIWWVYDGFVQLWCLADDASTMVFGMFCGAYSGFQKISKLPPKAFLLSHWVSSSKSLLKSWIFLGRPQASHVGYAYPRRKAAGVFCCYRGGWRLDFCPEGSASQVFIGFHKICLGVYGGVNLCKTCGFFLVRMWEHAHKPRCLSTYGHRSTVPTTPL